MHSLNIIILIILVACLLPYVFAFIARMTSSYDAKIHDSHRQVVEQSQGITRRADAVQKNSYEGLPLFIAAMLIADYLVVPDFFVVTLGIAYLILRVIYGLCYLANFNRLRSVFLGTCNVVPCVFADYLYPSLSVYKTARIMEGTCNKT